MKSNNTSMLILGLSLMIVMIGFGIAIPLMPFYITHFKASGSAMGLMMSLYSLMQFFFAPLWGRLSDRWGRKPALLVGVAGYAIAFTLQGISQDIVQFVLTRTLAGVLSAAALPAAMAYIADTTSVENRSKGVGMLGAAMGMGMIFGPLLGGLLTGVSLPLPAGLNALLQITQDPVTGEAINLSIPYFCSALLALLALPFIIFLLPESLPVEKRTAQQVDPGGAPVKANNRLTSLLDSLRGPTGFLFGMAFLLAFALANMEAVLGLYGQQRFQMTPAEVGMLMGGMGVLSVIQQGLLIGPLTRRFGEERIVQGGLAVSIVGFLGLALSPLKAGMMVSALVLVGGNVLLQPSVTALISRRTRDGQGTAMGVNNAFQSLGRGIGPLWAGLAFDIYSTLSFWSGALLQALAFFFALRLLGEREPNKAEMLVAATGRSAD